ncbi:MAG: hypothetical protein M3018_07765 [Actinomycetota bacterium]|nr:hypothetical protein [Actinomycetota bacterium]
MNARELEAASQDLSARRKRQLEAVAMAVACAVLALVFSFAPAVAIPLGAGAVIGALAAIVGELARQDKIACLALDPQAYELHEVARYASRLTTRLERERLASWLLEILSEAHIPGSSYLAYRVARYADEIAALSRDLSDPRADIRPASAAACHLLLTQAVDSPLYNPAVPAEQLPAIIIRIRLGISFSPA